MDRETYGRIESYMLACMQDAAHDKEHVYRVLRMALALADHVSEAVDRDILTAACLLHDIGRSEQFRDPAVCHARVGSEKAHAFLLRLGWSAGRSEWTAACILTHRYRSSSPPVTIEARLLFDADKLDVTGAVGIARTLVYGGQVGQALYTRGPDGIVLDGSEDGPPSFLHEYRHKLTHVSDRLFTPQARALAARRQPAACDFYERLLEELGVAPVKRKEGSL